MEKQKSLKRDSKDLSGEKLPRKMYDYYTNNNMSNSVIDILYIPILGESFASNACLVNPKVIRPPQYTKFDRKQIAFYDSIYIKNDIFYVGDFIIKIYASGKTKFIPRSETEKFDEVLLSSF